MANGRSASCDLRLLELRRNRDLVRYDYCDRKRHYALMNWCRCSIGEVTANASVPLPSKLWAIVAQRRV